MIYFIYFCVSIWYYIKTLNKDHSLVEYIILIPALITIFLIGFGIESKKAFDYYMK